MTPVTHPARTRPRSRLGVAVATSAVAATVSVLPLAPVAADTAPPSPSTATTVSADALPTVQVDGVVWAQVVAGSRVYVTGSFSRARPAGAAPGTNETPRSNILAFDLATGALITSWAPSLNAQGLAIAASPDGSRIYVGGDFTQVSGINRYRIAALDATTGDVLAQFTPGMNARVRALAVTDDTVYAGGIFTTVAGQARQRLAAMSTTNGAVLPWSPTADAEVMALTAPRGTGTVVAGGRFTLLSGAANYGMGALNATTGAVLPWPANAVVRNAGTNSAINSLSSDGARVYGTGYTYGSGGNFEGTFAADAASGALEWVTGCRGDTYGAVPIGGVLYSVSHAHDCSSVGGLPQSQPWTYQRAMASTTTAAADGRVNVGGRFPGQPAPELLHWLPTLTAGTYTGQSQAAWAVTGTSQYVVLGGEFPAVNGTAQQGLARFAVRQLAPNAEGPIGYSTLTPTLTAVAPGAVRATWTAAWDRDNQRLTYELLRGPTLSSSVVVGTVAADSTWWQRPALAFTDTSAPPGSTATYRVRVSDPLGNTMTSVTADVNVPAGAAAASRYTDAVRADGAASHWRLGEAAGRTGYDWSGSTDLTLGTASQRGLPGALAADPNTATGFPGSDTVPAASTLAQPGPQTFTVEAWLRTSTSRGGKLIGFGNRSGSASTSYDRHVYLTNAGRLVFGVYPGSVRTVTSPDAYNDGQWHHVAASLGADGMRLYADGELVASRSDTTSAQVYTGYWRVAGDTLGGSWPTRPSDANINASIDEVAVYPTALAAGAIARHNEIGRNAQANQPPTAAFSVSTADLTASFDAAASSDPDGAIAGYEWDFGDGASGSGVSPQHAYASANSYQVRLTVTDDGGASDSATKTVTVTAPPVSNTVAEDGFGRTVASGLGVADVGGAWSFSGGGTSASVADGSARVALTPGRSATMLLGDVQSPETDIQHSVWLEQQPTGSGVYLSTTVRSTSTGDYRGRVRIQSSGDVQVSLSKVVGGSETVLTSSVVVPGVSYTPGTKLMVRVQAVGSAPTTLRMKVWPAAGAEPSGWQREVTDASAGLQSAGAVGLWAYLSGSATVSPVIVRYDDLVATRL